MRAKILLVLVILMMVLAVTPVFATRNVLDSDASNQGGSGGPFTANQQTAIVKDTNGNLFYPDYSGDTITGAQRITAFGISGAPGQDIEDRSVGTYITMISKVTSTCVTNCGIGNGISFSGGSSIAFFPVPISFVGGATRDMPSSATSSTVTYSSSTGNTVLLSVAIPFIVGCNPGSVSSITDTGGSTISFLGGVTNTAAGDQHRTELWSSTAGGSKASTSFTVNFSASCDATYSVVEYKNIVSLGAVTTATGATSPYTISFTLTTANNFFIAGIGGTTSSGVTCTTGNCRQLIAGASIEAVVDNTASSPVSVTDAISMSTSPSHFAAVGVEAVVGTGKCIGVAVTSCTITLSLFSGNTLVLFSTQSATTTTITGITGGGTWTSCTTLNSCLTNATPNLRNEIWLLTSVSASAVTNIVVTYSASTNSATGVVQYSGLSTATVTCCAGNTPTGGTTGYSSVPIDSSNGFSVFGFGYGGTVSSIVPTANHGLRLWVSGNGGLTWTINHNNELSDLATDPNCVPVTGTSAQQPALNLHGTNLVVATGCFPGATNVDMKVLSFLLSYSGSTFSAASRQASATFGFTECNGCGSEIASNIYVISSTAVLIAFEQTFTGDSEFGVFNPATLAETSLSGVANTFNRETPTTMCGGVSCAIETSVGLQPSSLDFYLLIADNTGRIDYIRFTKGAGATWTQGTSIVLSTDAASECCGFDIDNGDLYAAWENTAKTNIHMQYVNSAGYWTDLSPGGNCASACMPTQAGVFLMTPHTTNLVSYTIASAFATGPTGYITQTTPTNTAVRVTYRCNSSQCTPGNTLYGFMDLSTSFVWGSRTDNPDVPAGTYGANPGLAALTCDGTLSTTFCAGSATGLPPYDYSLNSPSVTINPGVTGTVTITATKIGGPNMVTTLSCSGLPAGITCNSFSVNPGTPTFSSVLTIGVGSGVVAGTYTFSVTGSPRGASSATSTVSVTVPPSDYSLSNNGPIIVTRNGITGTQSATVVVTATFIGGAHLTPTFSCTGLPVQITCTSFNPTSCQVTCSTTLTFSVSITSRATYTFQVTATPLGSTTTPTTITVTVVNANCLNDAGGNSCVFTSCSFGTCGADTSNIIQSLILLFVVLIGVYILHEKVLESKVGGRHEREYKGIGGEDRE